MIIRPLGHACFLLTAESGFRLVTDPFDVAMGYARPPLEADVVTISHEHWDHNSRDWVGNNPVYLDKAGNYHIGGIHIDGFACFHDDQAGALRGPNVLFTYQMDGLRVCHLGDLGHQLDSTSIRRIGRVDVLLLPVGGTFTLDAERAWELAQVMMPRLIIPMHYKTSLSKSRISPVTDFLAVADQPYQTLLTLDASPQTMAGLPPIVVLGNYT